MVERACSVNGCDGSARTRGWCHAHYMRWYTTGETPSDGPIRRRVRGNVEVRLDAYRDMSAGPDGCWPWTGGRNPNGYGLLKAKGSGTLAHRAAYELAFGSIPAGMIIDHRCGNRACVNPAHLRACVQKQNMENLRSPYRTSTSGIRGVSWHKETQKWRAHVTHNGRTQHLGLFTDIESAEAAVIAKRLELFTHNDADRN